MKKLTVAFLVLFFIPIIFLLVGSSVFSGKGSGAGLEFYYLSGFIFIAISLLGIILAIASIFNKKINKKRSFTYLAIAIVYFCIGFIYFFGFFIEVELSQTKNELVCFSLPNDQQKITCFQNVALARGEVSICDQITEVINNYVGNNSACHSGTITTFDKNGKPSTQNVGQQCASEADIHSGDVPMCYIAVINKFKLKDLGICNNIIDSDWKNVCVGAINNNK